MDEQRPNSSAAKSESAPRPRKPYAKPDFRFEPVFETMALACAKAGSQSHCQIIKKRS
jgi:hypothetical protein